LSLVSDQRTGEDRLLAGDFNGIPSRKNSQINGLEHTMESGRSKDLMFKKTAEEE
jgi:hypothetical protein